MELPLDLDPEDEQVYEAAESQGTGTTTWQRYGRESYSCLRLYHAAIHSRQNRCCRRLYIINEGVTRAAASKSASWQGAITLFWNPLSPFFIPQTQELRRAVSCDGNEPQTGGITPNVNAAARICRKAFCHGIYRHLMRTMAAATDRRGLQLHWQVSGVKRGGRFCQFSPMVIAPEHQQARSFFGAPVNAPWRWAEQGRVVV